MLKTIISRYNINNLLNVLKDVGSNNEQVLHLRTYSKSKWQHTKKMVRTWERVTGTDTGTPIGDSNIFTLLSYNILAQDLLAEHLYLYIGIEPAMLRWDHRLLRLMEEIRHIKPDILCLQEMQFNHLQGFVKHISFKKDWEYVYKKKTGHRTDGCAIIYDKSKFRLLAERPVEYYNHSHALLNRDNVALLAKFSVKNQPQRKFVIATTHLLYNPRRQDVRTAQVEVLLAAIQQFAVENEGGKHVPLPVILTGDFNFEPKTRPYQLLTEPCKPVSSIRSNITENDTASGSKQEPSKEYYVRLPAGEENKNYLQLAPVDFGAHTASTFQQKWTTVDYVLYSIDHSSRKVQIQSVYELPKISDCIRTGTIPNKFLGSDHYSLGIKFSVL